MSFENTFGMTSDIVSMLRQYGRTGDVVKAGTGARLRTAALRALEGEMECFTEESLAELTETCVGVLERDLQVIVQDFLGVALMGIEITRRPKSLVVEGQGVSDQDDSDDPLEEEGEDYYLSIFIDDGIAAELNISRIGNTLDPDFSELIRERPVLCWLLDSRSPFYSAEFTERLRDAAVMMNFRGVLATDPTLQEEATAILGQVLRGNLH